MTLRLTVVTPVAPVLDAEVDAVVVPGAEGEFGVLPSHERFLAPLREGTIRYSAAGQTQQLHVTGGFAEVTEQRVVILADAAEGTE